MKKYDEILTPPFGSPENASPFGSPLGADGKSLPSVSPPKFFTERDYFYERVVPVDCEKRRSGLDVEAVKNFDFPRLVENLATGPSLNVPLTLSNFGVDADGKKNFTILMWLSVQDRASPSDDLKMLEYLLVNGASYRILELPSAFSAFHLAVLNRSVEYIERFLDVTKMPCDYISGYGHTGLILASGAGREDLVQLFIRRGASVTAADREGRTSLMFAAEKGHLKIVKRLLDAGAKTDQKCNEHHTALWYFFNRYPRPYPALADLLQTYPKKLDR